MKKLIFAAIIAVVSLSIAHAQSIQSVKFGAKAGVNFANLVGDDVEDASMRTSFHVGGVVDLMISDKFSFQPELLYSSQGARYKYDENGFDVEQTLKLDYLNLPLMGKFHVTEEFSLHVGPQIGFLLAANAKIESEGITVEDDVKDFIKDIDFGVNLGAGYKLPSGLFFDARYNIGLSNLPDEGDDKVRNSVIQVSVGYLF